MKITNIKFYNGSKDKICRLGLSILFIELQQILFETKILLLEEKDANGAAVIRKAIDNGFQKYGNWKKNTSGGVDWKKEFVIIIQ